MFKSITFEVIGDQQLVCEGCEERVEHALKTLEGVGKVRAHARNQRIDVLFDEAVLDTNAIAERVAKAGYQTRVVSSPSDSHR
jgi:copper chaperone CopZ